MCVLLNGFLTVSLSERGRSEGRMVAGGRLEQKTARVPLTCGAYAPTDGFIVYPLQGFACSSPQRIGSAYALVLCHRISLSQ